MILKKDHNFFYRQITTLEIEKDCFIFGIFNNCLSSPNNTITIFNKQYKNKIPIILYYNIFRHNEHLLEIDSIAIYLQL